MTDDRTIPISVIIDNAGTRELCGGVSRHTLIRWRADHDFPEPILTLTTTELWDRREVEAWLKKTAGWRRRRRR